MSPQLALEGGPWRVRFVRRGDRYAHVVEVRDGSSYQAVLESLEGAADEAWPTSPPLQDLHVEERGEVQVALLVGRAGRSHWSLSIELNAAANVLALDAACRVSEKPQWLGSSYRLLRPPPNWSLADCGLGVTIEPDEGVRDVRLDQGAGEVCLAAAVPPKVSSQTIRWAYRLAQRSRAI